MLGKSLPRMRFGWQKPAFNAPPHACLAELCGAQGLKFGVFKNDATSQSGKICGPSAVKLIGEGDWSMTSRYWRITLVLRTIGARRGRAARGRPVAG
jgi:hypothetical protein